MHQRSKYKLSIVNDYICITLIVAITAYTFYAITQMPDIIPLKSSSGRIDSYGNKWSILAAPGITIVMYLLSILFTRYLNKRNRSTVLISWLKLGLVVFFTTINFNIIQSLLE